jgi:hypothetical protein
MVKSSPQKIKSDRTLICEIRRGRRYARSGRACQRDFGCLGFWRILLKKDGVARLEVG